MERLTMVAPAPGETPVPGWTNESWREYATASVEHIDLHPVRRRRLREHASRLSRAWRRRCA